MANALNTQQGGTRPEQRCFAPAQSCQVLWSPDPDTAPVKQVSPPVKPKPAKPCTRFESLRFASLLGRAELERLAAIEQGKRDEAAGREWEGYRLVGRAGCRWAVAIQNPQGVRYVLDVTTEGVKRFVGCRDQAFVDALNDSLRACGSNYRVECKHAKIWHFRERARAAGLIDWMEA